VSDLIGADNQINRANSLDWHWDSPGWPASALSIAGLARDMIIYRCFYCKAEFIGAPVAIVLHHGICHAGRKPAITMYPISTGIAPRGGDQ